MAGLREQADLVIDLAAGGGRPAASDRRVLRGRQERRLTLSVLSFAYRGGLPRGATSFDVRFLTNPHYVDELRPLHGRDPAVRAYVEADPSYRLLLERLEALLFPSCHRTSAKVGAI